MHSIRDLKNRSEDYSLSVEELSVSFETQRGRLLAVDRLSFEIASGETIGVVGESGSGKSVTSLALMGLLPPNAKASCRSFTFGSEKSNDLSAKRMQALAGKKIAMIFQDPMTSLNPSFTVSFQIDEVIKATDGGKRKERRKRAIALLERVGIPDAAEKMGYYPHQLSGGLSQRVMIAMALAAKPRLLIADEPTTALDVTIQAQILSLMKELQEELGMSLLMITHDLGVVANMTERVVVMYGGQIVESGKTKEVIAHPTHPYTEGLLNCLPETNWNHRIKTPLPTIPGIVPDLHDRPSGCLLAPRCPYAESRCREDEPNVAMVGGQLSRCIKPLAAVRSSQ